MSERPRRWNHNIHYHGLVLDAVSNGARSALDVGTGDGLLAADLAAVVDDVVAIDIDDDVLESARTEVGSLEWVCGDVMDHPFGRTFDVVASVATIHHLPGPHAAFTRLAELTAPGGVLVIVGLAQPSSPLDYAYAAVGAVQHRWLSWRYGYWEHSAPTVWPPPQTYEEVARTALEVLPDARWRRLPLFRYALTWHRP
ncbi:class I SAM-dependent methyltransferase [Gordonia sp. (in: high G+C Gram-positive bacteria)]|uniref:class I SAM-dependent methyltransferase n=1 Tax=Gordonia sp. (in: high G+C Gram-positive bacteria) TaxID=84139 RepID=UPI003F9B3B10